MFTAMQNVVPSHLADNTIFDFKNLQKTGLPDAGGDLALDKPDIPSVPIGLKQELNNDDVQSRPLN